MKRVHHPVEGRAPGMTDWPWLRGDGHMGDTAAKSRSPCHGMGCRGHAGQTRWGCGHGMRFLKRILVRFSLGDCWLVIVDVASPVNGCVSDNPEEHIFDLGFLDLRLA